MNNINITNLSITLNNGETINFEQYRSEDCSRITINCSNSDLIPREVFEKAQAAATLLF